MEHVEKLANVVEVQAGGRLVEDVECVSRGAFSEFPGQLDALRLPTRQRRRRLAEW
jgi:hypothetical protein